MSDTIDLEVQRTYLTDRMKQVDTGLPMAYPNAVFNKPKDAPYGEFHIMGGDWFTVGGEGEGKARKRYSFMLQMTIWIPEGKGIGHATRAANAFSARFANRQGRDASEQLYRFTSIQPYTPAATPQNWKAAVFRIPYTLDVVEAVPANLTL